MNKKNSYSHCETTLVIYDNQCSFCCFWKDFIKYRIDSHPVEFVGRTSIKADQLKKEFVIPDSILESIILIQNNKFYAKSDAIFEIARFLKGYWKYLKYFKWIPRCLRNRVYDFIAFHRYSFMNSPSDKTPN